MIVGIDLGTTNSLVAYYTQDGSRIIPNRLGKHLTPSVVSVDEKGNVYVGETALERMSLYPDTVASAFKRSMGSDRESMNSVAGNTDRRSFQSGVAGIEGRCRRISGREK